MGIGCLPTGGQALGFYKWGNLTSPFRPSRAFPRGGRSQRSNGEVKFPHFGRVALSRAAGEVNGQMGKSSSPISAESRFPARRQVGLTGTQTASGGWSGFVIVSVTPAAGAAALPFNASVGAAASPPSCWQGGNSAVWRTVLTATARVTVVACGAGAGDAGRPVYSATVTVLPKAAVRVHLTLGGAGLTAAAFTPAIRSGFMTGVARELGVDALRVMLLQVPPFSPSLSSPLPT
jgi:hypothetical protein